MNRLVFPALLAMLAAGCTGEPAMCIHVEAVPSDDRLLREIAQRVGGGVGARVRDFTDDEPTEGNVADVFVKIDGGAADAVLAHQSMNPWICLYGEPGSVELLRLKSLFEDELKNARFKYTVEQRQRN